MIYMLYLDCVIRTTTEKNAVYRIEPFHSKHFENVAPLLPATHAGFKKSASAVCLSVILHPFSILLCNDWAWTCFRPSWIKYILLIILISSTNVLPPPPLNTPSGVQLRLEPIQPCHYLSAACLTDGKTFSHCGRWTSVTVGGFG